MEIKKDIIFLYIYIFYIRNDLLIISELQELTLKKVAENKHIKSCFYPENVMKGLMEKVEVLKETKTQ